MGKTIGEVDKNLKVETGSGELSLRFTNVRLEPFRLFGLWHPQEEPVFKRLPDEVAASVNEGVRARYTNTAGGRVRFSTDSLHVAIRAVMPSVTIFPHMSLAGTSGFDLYVDEPSGCTFFKTFMPPVGMTDGYESVISFPDRRMRQLTIHFPLYNDLDTLYIGLEETATLGPGAAYRHPTPVVYYGSSITQGGCASRPGNSYEAIIARRLDCDFVNLGFSGCARGEDTMTDHIAGLDMSVFVCDYDHNAPTPEHLAATHERLFRRFREKKPRVPVVLVSRPDFENGVRENILRRDIVYATYQNALNAGDGNVFFVDGQYLFKDENRDVCTVDAIHPNDAGFLRMAEVIGFTVNKALALASAPGRQ